MGSGSVTLTPDQVVLYQWGPIQLNATIVFTWVTMLLLILVALVVRRGLTSDVEISPGQNMLEIIVGGMRDHIRELAGQGPDQFLPFVGTLFLFIATCNLLSVVPGYQAPTASLSTTFALALCVFVSVPIYGISQRGLAGYLKQYVRPTPIMLPFHIIGEISRTIALAIRLFGNIMAGALIVAILLKIAPVVLPTLMQMLSLLTGLVQAYIFAVLAMVYIASATRASRGTPSEDEAQEQGAPEEQREGQASEAEDQWEGQERSD
ncbi:MAG: F0F1 ATP synthase subunit A [Armatimonadota bacterium]|nr:F0F1 ATP synthase subunit A [Armatimonadota bacterium]